MKKIIEDSGLISIVALFVLSFLQPFGIEQMTDRRMPFIILISLVAFVVSVLSFMIERAVTHRDASTVKDICMFHVINIPILSAVILSSISWFSWGNLHSAWYCTQGEFSVINYLVICVQVLLVSVFIFVEAIDRFLHPEIDIAYGQALVMAIVGCATNFVCAYLLHGGDGDVNSRAAYLHILSDVLTDLGAIAGLLCGLWWGISYVDAIVALVAACVVGRWAVRLLWTTGRELTINK